MSEYYKTKNAKDDYNKAVIDWINHKDDSADASADMKKTAVKEKAVDKPKAEKKVPEKKEPMSIKDKIANAQKRVDQTKSTQVVKKTNRER